MHILYLHQYFTSRSGATGTRSYEFSKYLVKKGHQVTMVTSGWDNPMMSIRENDLWVRLEVDGIQVVGVPGGYNDPKLGTGLSGIQRMRKFYEFARVAGRIGRKLTRPDMVLATHTPLPIGLAGIKLSRFFHVPFLFEVRDLWPEALTDAGLLSNPVVIWWLRRLAHKIYRRADHIIALSPGMKSGILAYGIPDDHVTVIPNASDLDLFAPDNDGQAWRQHLNLGKRFAAVYFGAMGRANGLDYVIEAARLLSKRGRDDIAMVLIGDGGQRPALQAKVIEYGLSNVIFQDPVPRADIAKAVAGAQACLTIFRPSQTNAWSPNKLFDSLAAGRPILINVPGWLGETVAGNQAGLCLDAHNPSALADALEKLSGDPMQCQAMGRQARAVAERDFDRMKLAARFESVLQKLVAEKLV
ncbi:glycosyltransferase family 4 protein [Planctomycetota bacterium]